MNKKDLSKKLNQELDETLFRFETIFDYYQENTDRINVYMEDVSKKGVITRGNINYLRGLCNEYFSLDKKIRTEYGIILGNNCERRIRGEDGSSNSIWVLNQDEGLDVNSDLIRRHNLLRERINLFRDEMDDSII